MTRAARAMARGALAVSVALVAGSCGGAGAERPGHRPLSPEELRVLAMRLLQRAVVEEIRLYRAEGRFTERSAELGTPVAKRFVVTSGVGAPGRVSVEVCAEDRVVVLGTEAGEGSVFVVKVRAREPPTARAVFSHYIQDPPCDTTDGPASWPNGYRLRGDGVLRGATG